MHLLSESQLKNNEVVQPAIVELERNLVDRLRRGRRDDRFDRNVAEQRDLLAQVVRHVLVGAGDDHVGLDADAAQLLDRVLGRLGLQLARRADSAGSRVTWT